MLSAPRPRLDLGGRAGRQHLAGVHRDQQIETLGLFHIGGGDDHAHGLAATRCAHPLHQLPELPARQRIDAGGRLVEDQQVGIVDQRAAQPEFLPHAAGEFLRRPVGEGQEAGVAHQRFRAGRAFRRGPGRTAARRRRCFPRTVRSG